MELVETSVPLLTRRSRSLVVRHGDAGLLRPLEPGERVVVRDPATDDYWAATVADRDPGSGATEAVYRIELEVRMPEEQALERVGEVAGHATLFREETVGMQDLLDLLGAVRGRRRAADAALSSLAAVRRSL